MALASTPVLIRLVPVISSTCSLWFSWDQYEFLTLFRKPDIRPLSNQILPSYFTSFFNRGVIRVIALLGTTAVSCGVILRSAPISGAISNTGASPWYIAGEQLEFVMPTSSLIRY